MRTGPANYGMVTQKGRKTAEALLPVSEYKDEKIGPIGYVFEYADGSRVEGLISEIVVMEAVKKLRDDLAKNPMTPTAEEEAQKALLQTPTRFIFAVLGISAMGLLLKAILYKLKKDNRRRI